MERRPDPRREETPDINPEGREMPREATGPVDPESSETGDMEMGDTLE